MKEYKFTLKIKATSKVEAKRKFEKLQRTHRFAELVESAFSVFDEITKSKPSDNEIELFKSDENIDLEPYKPTENQQ